MTNPEQPGYEVEHKLPEAKFENSELTPEQAVIYTELKDLMK